MEYLKIIILSMIPVTELRGAISIGIAMDLNTIGVYLASVTGSTIVAIPLVLTFRSTMDFLRKRSIFLGLIKNR